MKTARFKDVVKQCGRPEIHLSWSTAKEDKSLMAAVKRNQVMTLHQALRGSAKDYGTVGLMQTAHAQIVIFPRSLKAFSERRIIGIDYSLFAAETEPKYKSSTKKVNSPVPRGRLSRLTKTTDHVRPLNTEPAEEMLVQLNKLPEKSPQSIPAPPPPTWKDVLSEIKSTRADLTRQKTARALERLETLALRIEKSLNS